MSSIWSHIDLSPDSMLSARSHAYLARSKQALLDIHITVPDIGTSTSRQTYCYNDSSIILPLLAIAAPRTKHFTIEANRRQPDLNFIGLVAATLFENCIPNILREVAISTSRIMYLEQHPLLRDHIRSGRLTALLFPITVLRLELCQLDLASDAYHSLTELRLIDCDMPNSFELTSIFRLSPQLRIFEITSFKEDVPDSSPLTPVCLENLEVLVLGSFYYEELDSVLQLIEPSPKPLSLSIMYCISGWQFESFVACSNVTRLSTRGFETYSQLAEVISLMPSIRVLAVYEFGDHMTEDVSEVT
ncbi:hypothetical protein ACGC1H_003130 [Rhizoctonia solani]